MYFKVVSKIYNTTIYHKDDVYKFNSTKDGKTFTINRAGATYNDDPMTNEQYEYIKGKTLRLTTDFKANYIFE